MHLPSARPNERAIYEFSVAPAYTAVQLLAAATIPFIWSTFLAFLRSAGVLPAAVPPLVQWLLAAPALLAVLYLVLAAIYLRLARHYFLTTQRVVAINGWLAQQTISVDYATITDLTVLQDVFERFITHSGTLDVDTAGGPTMEISLIHVANPLGVRDQILELSEKARRLIARAGHAGSARSVSVAPASAALPIPTDPTIVDANEDGVIDPVIPATTNGEPTLADLAEDSP
jgi:hypothetical protein